MDKILIYYKEVSKTIILEKAKIVPKGGKILLTSK